ncbi:MAG: tRNA pseudouridine(54/55) synthase Pus10 [Candidatus Poseidoniales archaeon]|jgi:tRNA pseudouridine synthase 10|tara:strand:- start:911 stop:2347 length:1437 start_codon:yes stop_codon:yes gene_type:complete
MSQTNSKDSEENNEDDEWHKFSNAGYSSASVDSDAEIDKNVNDNQSGVWFDGDDFEFEGKTLDWNSPPCPTPLGVAHVIKIGTCNHCIERVSGKKNMSGEEIRSEAHVRDGTLDKSFETILCPLCENLFDDIGNIVNRIVDKISNLEYSTIQIGIHLPKDLINDEDEIRSRHGATGSRPLKSAMVVAIQNEININLGTDVNFVKEKPDLMVLIDGLTLRVDVDVRPIYFYGRYRKLSREIPQTRWPCRACKGRARGCESCNESGLQYLDSVQDLVGEPVRSALDAEDTSFHGMGREDIDVRMLGKGRPFIIEIKKPMSRIPDLEKLVNTINDNADGKVEIDSLKRTDRSLIAKIKASRSEKSYTIRFKVSGEIIEEEVISHISDISGVVLNQETPQRVSHRRAAKIRKRKVTYLGNIIIEGDEIQFDVRCEAGTYVKELVHSDEGRTIPSVSGKIGMDCEILWLDVTEIHDDEENQDN